MMEVWVIVLYTFDDRIFAHLSWAQQSKPIRRLVSVSLLIVCQSVSSERLKPVAVGSSLVQNFEILAKLLTSATNQEIFFSLLFQIPKI